MSVDRAPRVSHIGRYPVSAVVGTGAFATVYRARDERLDADVAVKVLAENHALDPDLRERFVLEGRLLRRVQDPHVIAVHELGETDRAQPFLVLDLAEGGDLRRRADEARAAGWTATAADVGSVARAVAGAMRALHTAEVVHRDLAPGNLLVVGGLARRAERGAGLFGSGERLVVADLGLSKDLARASGLTVGTGTSGFTPPEQRLAGGWVDTRADIWSASALLVWLLTGSAPDTDWPTLAKADRWTPALVDALAHGLATDPADRPGDADRWLAGVLEALDPARGDGGSEAPARRSGTMRASGVGSVRSLGGDRPVRWSRRWWGRVAAVAVAVASVAALGALVGRSLGRGSGAPSLSERVELDGGEVRYESTVGPSTLTVTGPGTVAVGDEAVLVAEGDRIERVDWIVPDRDDGLSGRRISLVPSSEGVATAVAVGRDGDGRQVIVQFRLRVEG